MAALQKYIDLRTNEKEYHNCISRLFDFGFGGFSKSAKLAAADKIIYDLNNNTTGTIIFNDLPPAAKQGRLGEICKQHAITDTGRTPLLQATNYGTIV